MKTLIILVGPSGSGKSTAAINIINHFRAELNSDFFTVSTDELREIISGSEGDQSVSRQAFDSARNLTHYLCRREKNILIDATNLYPKSRKQWIDIGKKYGYIIHAIVVEDTLENCVSKDSKRARVVGPEVIKNQFDKYIEPALSEGFSEIIFLSPKENGFKMSRALPELPKDVKTDEQKTEISTLPAT